MRRARPNESTATILFASIAVATVIIGSATWLQTLVTLPLLLALPGRSILRLINGPTRFDPQTIVFAVGLSMAVAVLCGLVLNGLGALNARGWAFCIGAVTIFASALSWLTEAPSAPSARDAGLPVWRPARIGTYVCAALIATGAVGLARSGAQTQHEYAFTQFWMVPAPKASGKFVTIGIRNDETSKTSYEVALSADGDNIARRTGITLSVGDSWSEKLQLDSRLQRARRIEAWLFKADAPDEIYRKVWLSNPDREINPSEDKG